jgi:hypothetical protein
MCKSKTETKNMRKQGNTTAQKVYNSSISESKDTKMVEMPDILK